jgi:hypothetical protein
MVMAAVFWDMKGVLLVDNRYWNSMLLSYRDLSHMEQVQPEKKIDVFLLYDNARLHTSLETTEAITELCWAVLALTDPKENFSDNALFFSM